MEKCRIQHVNKFTYPLYTYNLNIYKRSFKFILLFWNCIMYNKGKIPNYFYRDHMNEKGVTLTLTDTLHNI